MVRRPAFALSLVVLATALLVLETPRSHIVLPYAIPVLAGLAWYGAYRGSVPIARFASGAFLAVIVVLSTEWAAPLHPADPGSARLEGRVLHTRATSSGGWYVVAGELDLQQTPACACTVIVRSRSGKPLPMVASRVVVTGRAAPPRVDPGWADIEASWCRSRAATFLMDGTAEHVLQPPGAAHRLIEAVRNVIRSRMDALLPAQASATMQAMLMGDRTALESDLRDASVRTGTAHLFAVSGLHVGAVLGLVLLVTGGSVRRWYHWLAAVGCVAVFVVVTGAEPPAMRALIMAAGGTLGRMRQKHVDGLNLLGASILIELACWPSLILRPSFLLSTAVTAGLLWLVPPLVQRMRQWSAQRIWRAAVPMLSVHLAAAASSAIPGAVLFGSVSLIAPMVNLLVVPVMVLALLSTLVTLLAGWFAPTLGAVVGWTPSMLVSVADAVILTTAALQPDVPERAVPLAAILVTASVAWLLRASTPRYAAFRLIAGTLAIVTVVSMPPDPQHGVICRRIGDRVEVRATVPSEERRFVIGQRYGRPFVRSYRDRHSSHRAP